MNIFPNINLDSTRNLTPSTLSNSSISLKPLFYGDILQIEIYPHDGQGNFPAKFNGATFVVGIGTLTKTPYLEETITHSSGNFITANFDLSTSGFEEATRGIEEISIKLEIEVSYGTKIETITQIDGRLRNQMLAKEVVTLVAPLEPSEVNAELGTLPLAPEQVEADTTPLEPEQVEADLYNAPRLPLEPSEVIAVYESEPDVPSEVNASVVTAPAQVQWVIATSFANAPSEVNAEVITPVAPSEVNALNLYNVQPLSVTPLNFEPIPLEPSLVKSDTIPEAPSEIETDISPIETDAPIAYLYNARPAGWVGGEPSNLRAIRLFKAGNDDGSGKPSEVEAILDEDRLPNQPTSAFGQPISEVESDLLSPRSPSQVSSSSKEIELPSTLPIGEVSGENIAPNGTIVERGTIFRTYLDTSGSMNAILSKVRTAVEDIRTFASSVIYNGSSKAEYYVPSALNFSHEKWLEVINTGHDYQNEVVMVFLNESSSIYHNNSTLATSVSQIHRDNYDTFYSGKTKKHHAYVVGYEFIGSWSNVTNDFKRHLDYFVYSRTDGKQLSSKGVKGFMQYDSSAGSVETTNFLIDYLNLPKVPNDLNPTCVAHQSGQHDDKWIFDLNDIIEGTTGVYNENRADRKTATQEKWELVISFDGTTEALVIDLGEIRPQSYELLASYDSSLAGIVEVYGALRAKALPADGSIANSGIDKISSYALCGRKPATPSNIEAT